MPFTQRVGVDIHYELSPCTGTSRGPLLFIPGLSANTRAFPKLFAALAEDYDLVVVDPRGAGQTLPKWSRFKLHDVAMDALAVLDAEGIERCHVIGLSMGGMIAQEMVLEAPERVRGLVLTCTTCGRRPGVSASPRILSKLVKGIGAARGPATAEGIATSFGGILFASGTPLQDQVNFFGPRTGAAKPTKAGVASQLWAARKHATFDRLHRIKHPTLVIHGDSDILVPTVNASILADAIPSAELAILPGGHVFFFEQHDEYLARTRAFLTRVEADS